MPSTPPTDAYKLLSWIMPMQTFGECAIVVCAKNGAMVSS